MLKTIDYEERLLKLQGERATLNKRQDEYVAGLDKVKSPEALDARNLEGLKLKMLLDENEFRLQETQILLARSKAADAAAAAETERARKQAIISYWTENPPLDEAGHRTRFDGCKTSRGLMLPPDFVWMPDPAFQNWAIKFTCEACWQHFILTPVELDEMRKLAEQQAKKASK